MDDTDEQIKEAEAQGWSSEYEGDNKKTASEFIHDGKFFKEIGELKSKNKKLSQSFDQLTTHYEKVRANDLRKAETDYQEKIEQLKSEKVQALDEGDNRRVVEIDEQLRTTEKPVVDNINPVNADFDNWVKTNGWYDDSEFLRVEADSIGQQYYDQGKRGTQLFTAIEKHIKRKYPNDFENENRSRPASVEGGTNGNPKSTSGKAAIKDLTRQEREVFERFKSNGIFKTDESIQTYLNQVMEVR